MNRIYTMRFRDLKNWLFSCFRAKKYALPHFWRIYIGGYTLYMQNTDFYKFSEVF
jgi:hypothetical protein